MARLLLAAVVAAAALGAAAMPPGDQPPIDGDLKLDISTPLFEPWGNSSSAVEGSTYSIGELTDARLSLEFPAPAARFFFLARAPCGAAPLLTHTTRALSPPQKKHRHRHQAPPSPTSSSAPALSAPFTGTRRLGRSSPSSTAPARSAP